MGSFRKYFFSASVTQWHCSKPVEVGPGVGEVGEVDVAVLGEEAALEGVAG
jgi:hypothetical protein